MTAEAIENTDVMAMSANRWMKEIALQLAVLNAREAAREAARMPPKEFAAKYLSSPLREAVLDSK